MDIQQISTGANTPKPRAAHWRAAYLLVALGAGVLAVLLLVFSVQVVGAAPATPAPAHDGGGEHDEDDELYGQLLLPVTAFVGEWVLAIDGTRQITIVLSAATEVRKFGDRLPAPGAWLEAEGVFLPDGRLEAQRVRPDDFEANEVIVRLKPTDDPAARAQELASQHEMTVSAVLPSANIFLFTTTDDEENEVSKLTSHPSVEWAEINWVSRAPTGDPYRTWKWGEADENGYTNQHAFEQVNLGSAQTKVTGAGVIVAILDTGIDLEHPAFVSHLALLANSNMISDTGAPDDTGPGLAWGHGTHVAGIVHGIAPDATLLPIRVLDSQGRGNTFVLAYAIELAVNSGASVINLSLGADCASRVLREAVQSAIAQGVVIVAAAGNDGSETSQCPASLPGVLSVAAVTENRQRTTWSNYGAWVSLAAPGEGITSTFPLGLGAETDATPGYASWSGTSMATPFVAGAAALAVEYAALTEESITPAEQLVTHGDDISALNPAPFVVGRHLNIAAAVDGLPTEPEPTPAPSPVQLYLPAITR